METTQGVNTPECITAHFVFLAEEGPSTAGNSAARICEEVGNPIGKGACEIEWEAEDTELRGGSSERSAAGVAKGIEESGDFGGESNSAENLTILLDSLTIHLSN